MHIGLVGGVERGEWRFAALAADAGHSFEFHGGDTAGRGTESLESLVSILVGVNVQDPTLSQLLMELYRDAGFTQYVELADASPEALARLAGFVARSILSQSVALGSGGPSRSLVF